MTERIRWEPTKYGGWTGHVGTARDWLFQVWLADTAAAGWQLDSTLPGQFGSGWHRCDNDPDTLKAEAERWLEEFVSSLGVTFVDQAAEPLTDVPMICTACRKPVYQEPSLDCGRPRDGDPPVESRVPRRLAGVPHVWQWRARHGHGGGR